MKLSKENLASLTLAPSPFNMSTNRLPASSPSSVRTSTNIAHFFNTFNALFLPALPSSMGLAAISLLEGTLRCGAAPSAPSSTLPLCFRSAADLGPEPEPEPDAA